MFTDIAASGEEVLAAGRDAGTTHAFRLGAGGDPNDAAAWQQLDPAKGREPALAGLPGSFAVMLEPSGPSAGSLFVQRLEGAAWSPPVPLIPAVNNNGFQLAGNTKGRLTAVINYSAYRLVYMTSTDGGVLWSSDVNIGNFDEYPSALQVCHQRDGRRRGGLRRRVRRQGRARHALHARAPPRSRAGASAASARACRSAAPAAATSSCRSSSRRPAATAGSRPRPSCAGPASAAPAAPAAASASKFRARYDLRRRTARIPVRVTPRRGKARTLRLRVRRCGATR